MVFKFKGLYIRKIIIIIRRRKEKRNPLSEVAIFVSSCFHDYLYSKLHATNFRYQYFRTEKCAFFIGVTALVQYGQVNLSKITVANKQAVIK